MKKIILMMIAMTISFASFAQNKDVTTFLGIPVDGTASSMKQKLVSKGFVPKKVGTNEFLEGEFNGCNVNVWIGTNNNTNNNKVYRIMLCDKNTVDEAQIKIRFNNLVKQFENNKRYHAFADYSLSDKEDISYEMGINNKEYVAYYLQDPDFENIDAQIQTAIEEKYSAEELKNPSETVKNDIKDITNKILGYHFMKRVWFRIDRYRYNGECLKSCKIGDIPCKDFIMYKFIRTSISSKYKDAKVKGTSFTSAKDEGTLNFVNEEF